MKYFTLILSIILWMGCGKKSHEQVSSLEIVGPGSDMPSVACKFSPPENLVRRFFDLAKPLSNQEEYMTYGWSPCYLEGIVNMNKKIWRFKLRPTGSAQLLGEDQKITILGCLDCAPGLALYKH